MYISGGCSTYISDKNKSGEKERSFKTQMVKRL